MTVFVDTSAILAVLIADEVEHERAARAWADLVRGGERLRTHNYVIVEVAALVQRRRGMDAARALHAELLPALSVRFVDHDLHRRAVTALLAADRRSVSLVDWTSFELMREEGISAVFAFDDDFAGQGFTVRP